MTAPKPDQIPNDAQIAQWEASTAMALRVLHVLAEVITSGEMASSGYLRKRCGLSAEEWHGSGELMAALICFASDKGFLEWHARDMVGATTDPNPSDRLDRIADAVIDFYSNHSSDGLERDAPNFTRAGLKFAISTAGLADLRRQLAKTKKEVGMLDAAIRTARTEIATLQAENERYKNAHNGDECGCKIEFIEGPNGKHIPVQKVRTIYVEDRGKLLKAAPIFALGSYRKGPFYVSHFETCSKPGRFSRGG